MKTKLAKITLATSLSALILSATLLSALSLIPQTAKAETTKTATQSSGLITPKDTDPVIFTTESGLDIKYGNASTMPSTYNSSLASGNLAGFPYFTTTSGSTTYTWVIIGQGLDMSNVDGTQRLDNTPAGTAIKNDSKLALEKYFGGYDGSVVANAEIPNNAVLCWLNGIAGSGRWADTQQEVGHAFSGSENLFRVACEGYYTNDTFGFGNLKSSILNTTITMWSAGYTTVAYGYYKQCTTTIRFFPLGVGDTWTNHGNTSITVQIADYENFRLSTYISVAQSKTTSEYWGRSNQYDYMTWLVKTDGTISYASSDNTQSLSTRRYSAGYRPACVLSLL